MSQNKQDQKLDMKQTKETAEIDAIENDDEEVPQPTAAAELSNRQQQADMQDMEGPSSSSGHRDAAAETTMLPNSNNPQPSCSSTASAPVPANNDCQLVASRSATENSTNPAPVTPPDAMAGGDGVHVNNNRPNQMNFLFLQVREMLQVPENADDTDRMAAGDGDHHLDDQFLEDQLGDILNAELDAQQDESETDSDSDADSNSNSNTESGTETDSDFVMESDTDNEI